MSTQEDAFTGKKPNVSYFKIFGSSIYVHVTKYIRNKLEPITDIGIFFRVHLNSPQLSGVFSKQ